MKENLTEYLDKVEWEGVVKRLNHYASQKIRWYGSNWRRGAENLPDGRKAEDLVNDAILQLYDGTRKWDDHKCPILLTFLKGVVRSLVSNAANGKENKTSTRYNTSEPPLYDIMKLKGDGFSLSPEEIHIADEDSTASGELCRQCRAIIDAKNDVVLSSVFLMLLQETDKPQEISEKTGIEVKRVYNHLKRIGRALKVLSPESVIA